MKKLDLKKGDVFSKLTVVGESERRSPNRRRFLCTCECGNSKEVDLAYLVRGIVKSCGCSSKNWHKLHSRNKNPNWKGGERIESSGYTEVYKPDHPSSRQNGYIKKHRLIMEQKLGRKLLPEENVHHRNGDKSDNRIENLELWNTSQPSGQRVEDKLVWAKRIMELYG